MVRDVASRAGAVANGQAYVGAGEPPCGGDALRLGNCRKCLRLAFIAGVAEHEPHAPHRL